MLVHRAATVAAIASLMACGSTGEATDAGAPDSVDAATAERVVAAGIVEPDDLEGDWGDPGYDEAGEEVDDCLLGDDGTIAYAGSDVLGSDDDRGPTLVSVTVASETLVYPTTDAASAALEALDEDVFAACIESSVEGLDAVDVELLGGAASGRAGGKAMMATFDVDWGEGDDNTDAAELYATQVGPALQLLWTTRSGEDHSDAVVDEPTIGIDKTVADLTGRVSAALG